MSNITSIFVGGPADGKSMIIPDVMEYAFLVEPELELADYEKIPEEFVPYKTSIYSRRWTKYGGFGHYFDFVKIK